MLQENSNKKSISEAAAILGKAGGIKGGPARALALSKDERISIASKGGEAKSKISRQIIIERLPKILSGECRSTMTSNILKKETNRVWVF